jgi:hypothetical protein
MKTRSAVGIMHKIVSEFITGVCNTALERVCAKKAVERHNQICQGMVAAGLVNVAGMDTGNAKAWNVLNSKGPGAAMDHMMKAAGGSYSRMRMMFG